MSVLPPSPPRRLGTRRIVRASLAAVIASLAAFSIGPTTSAAVAPYAAPRDLTASGGLLYFTATDGVAARELWVSDGTLDGTHMVKDIRADGTSEPRELTDFNGTLYFVASDGAGDGLWKTDGSEGGTEEVADLQVGSLAAVGTTLYIATEIGNHNELWASDGSASGTELIEEISGRDLYQLTRVGDTLYFTATRRADGAMELWRSNGTAASTYRVKTLPNEANHLTAVAGSLSFVDWQCLGVPCFPIGDLWTSDGTSSGTRFLKDGGIDNLVAMNSKTFFRRDNALWRSNGTVMGTRRVARFDQLDAFAMLPTVVSGELFFSATTGPGGASLWRTDGTSAGTVEVDDVAMYACEIYQPCHSYDNTASMGDRLYFASEHGPNGIEIWRSDGTADGTRLLKDIRAGAVGSAPSEFVRVGSTLYFAANDGVHGRELWMTDGTRAGTVLVEDINT